jgi:cell division protein FtsL
MKSRLALSLALCIGLASLTLYTIIERQNELMEVRMELPPLAQEVKALQEENNRLQYEIDRFESPIHLMELAKKPDFSHLRFPRMQEVVILPQGTISGEAP